MQAELDATQTGAGLNADGTYTIPTGAQGAVYTVGATSLRNADLNLDEGLQAEKNARQNADDAIEDALLDATNDLQGQISSNDTDIEALQDQVDLINLAAQGGPEWKRLSRTIQNPESSTIALGLRSKARSGCRSESSYSNSTISSTSTGLFSGNTATPTALRA